MDNLSISNLWEWIEIKNLISSYELAKSHMIECAIYKISMDENEWAVLFIEHDRIAGTMLQNSALKPNQYLSQHEILCNNYPSSLESDNPLWNL